MSTPARSWCSGSRCSSTAENSSNFCCLAILIRPGTCKGATCSPVEGWSRGVFQADGHVEPLFPKNNPYPWKMCLAKSDVFCSGCKFWPLQPILLLAYCSKNEQLNLPRQAYFAEPKQNVATKIQQISANFTFFFVQPCTFYMLFHLGPNWWYPFLLPCEPQTRQSKFVDDFKGRVTDCPPCPMIAMYPFSSYPRTVAIFHA